MLARFHAGSGIGHRHTVLPLEQYRDLHSFGESNDLWISEGTDLAARAVSAALDAAGLVAAEVDYLLFTSVTGIAAPPSTRVSCHGSGCAPTSSGCRRSASAAWRVPRGWRGCTTT